MVLSTDGSGDAGEDSAGGSSDGEGSDGGPSTAEQFVMVASAAFTVSLFAFAVWQAVTLPAAGAPTVSVVDQQTAPSGDVIFTVALANPQDTGLVRATVEAECTDPPTELTFENVPVKDRRTGRIVCPPGTETPGVSVASWIER